MDAKNNYLEDKQHIRWLKWATVAAVVATLGDFIFMRLFMSDTTAMELNTAKIFLLVGGVSGAIAIPFYAIGYRAVAAIIFTSKSPMSKLFMRIVVVASLCGGAIHGITAVNMYGQIKTASLGTDPIASMMDWGGYILGLWAVAIIGIVIVSSLYFWIVLRGETKLKREMAYLNPVFITIGISLISLLFGTAAGTYIAPTAPNMANIMFFILMMVTIKRNSKNKY